MNIPLKRRSLASSTSSAKQLSCKVQQAVRIDVALELGAVSQTVEVTAETPLLQPTTTSLGQVINERETNEIPLNGRNVFSLITLSPAAIAGGNGSGNSTGGSQVGPNPFSWGNYQVGGSFGNESAQYIDGQPVNIGYINLPGSASRPGRHLRNSKYSTTT